MNYKKIEHEHYNLHVIQTDKFKTIKMEVYLKRLLKKEDITKRNVLVNTLLESTKKYPSRRLLEIETEELYDLGYKGSNYNSGKYTILSFNISFLNPKYTEENMDEKSIKFLNEILFNPNVNNNMFNQKNFDMAINIMRDHLESMEENAALYSQIKMLEEMDDSIISYRSSGYIEDLDKLNPKDLYEYYLDVINNDIVDIFIIGDVDVNRIDSLIENNMLFKNNNKSKESHYYVHNEISSSIKEVKEKSNKEQSTLVIGTKFDEMTDFEKRYVLSIYNYILGGSTDSNLFINVREKNSLCYYINSSIQPLLSIGIIKAGINSKDYDKVIDLVKLEIDNMKQGNFNDDKLNNAIVSYINSLSELEDNPSSIISLYTCLEYLDGDLIEDRIKNIKKVTKEDVIKLANKIHLNTIFLLEGSDDNEEE